MGIGRQAACKQEASRKPSGGNQEATTCAQSIHAGKGVFLGVEMGVGGTRQASVGAEPTTAMGVQPERLAICERGLTVHQIT